MATLHSYLKANKISQADFAALVGVKQPSVHRWLNGSRPSWTAAEAIERVTKGGVPVSVWASIHDQTPNSDAVDQASIKRLDVAPQFQGEGPEKVHEGRENQTGGAS